MSIDVISFRSCRFQCACEHRPRRSEQVGTDLADDAEVRSGPERGAEDLGGEVLQRRAVADAAVHDAVQTFDVVQVDRFPVGIPICPTLRR